MHAVSRRDICSTMRGPLRDRRVRSGARFVRKTIVTTTYASSAFGERVSPSTASDSSMNVAQTFDYAPYGSVIATTNTGTTKAARPYIGQFTDDSGLTHE
jgi:hypothetical protein